MDFKSGQQLIGLCETNECPISESIEERLLKSNAKLCS